MKRNFQLILFLLIITGFSSCQQNSTIYTKTDTFPPKFSGIKSVTAINNDLVFDYFMVRWYKAEDDVTPSDKITYKVYYKRSETELTPILAGVVTGETLSYIVKIQRQTSDRELLPYYYFQVAAIDEAGNVKESKIVEAKAEDFNPPSWGYITEVKELDFSHLLIKWMEAEDDRTYPSHIKYNIFAATTKSEIDYSKPISVVVGKTQCVVNLDLRNFQNKTIYFTVVAEDLSGNKNINGIFRSLKVGNVKMLSLGNIRRPVGREFKLDLSTIAPGMGFKLITAPKDTKLSGNDLLYTPQTTTSVYFHIEGNNVNGDISVITFTLLPFEPPVKYTLTSPITFMVPSTNETIYSLSPTTVIDKYELVEKFDSFVISPTSTTKIDFTPVTWSAAPGYFSYVTVESGKFYLKIVDLNKNNVLTKTYPIAGFQPCQSDSFTTNFLPSRMSMNKSFIVMEGSGIIEGVDLMGEKEFAFFLKQKTLRKDLVYCNNQGSETIGTYGRGATIEAIPYNATTSNMVVHLIRPSDKVLLLVSNGDNVQYSLSATSTDVFVKQLAVSPSGEVYLLGSMGSLYYLYGSSWINIINGVRQLLYGGYDVYGISNSGIYYLNGVEDPLNILPSECGTVISNGDRIKGIVNQAERVWLILANRVYSCSK